MRTLVIFVLLAGCSRVPDGSTPEPRVPEAMDAQPTAGGVFEVLPKSDGSTGHDLIAFVGRDVDLESLTKAHISKDGSQEIRLLRTSDDLKLYLLWGRRIDVLAKGGLTVDRGARQIKVTATWKYSSFGGMSDTGGIHYVGYGVRLGRMAAGRYVAEVYENTRVVEEGRRLAAQITFDVVEGAGGREPAPPPEVQKELPRLTCESGCCVGMHTFKLGTMCQECQKVQIADGHKYCSSCAQRLRRCVHCGQPWK